MVVCQLILSALEYPDYLEPLREEIENAIRERGVWNKDACARMPKSESFLRETLRLSLPTARKSIPGGMKLDSDILLTTSQN